MGLTGSLGLKSSAPPPSSGTVLPALVGQDIVARSIELTQVAGSNAVLIDTAGARLKLSNTGTTDYMTSDGLTKLSFAGDLETFGFIYLGNDIRVRATTQTIFTFTSVAGFYSPFMQGNAGNGGGGANLWVVGAQPNAETEDLIRVFNGNTGSTVALRVKPSGKFVVPDTDSSGTPGNATANTPSGKAAFAAVATTVVISNTLVTANSRIFVQLRTRDASGTDPVVTAQTAGVSFTVTVAAATTGITAFDWWIVN